jgi:hypothetical protein
MVSEQEIKNAVEKIAGDLRYYKPEMADIIPLLIGSIVRDCDPFDIWEKDPVVSQMINLGWKDRVIALAIQVSKTLGDK